MISRFVYLVVFFFVLLAFIYFIKEIKNLPDYTVPKISDIWRVIESNSDVFMSNTWLTFKISITGYFISIISAFMMCVLAATNQRVSEALYQFSITWQSYPIVALAPIFFIVFGDGWTTKFIIIVTLCYFPIFLAMLGAIRSPVIEVEYFYENIGQLTLSKRIEIRMLSRLRFLFSTIIGSSTLAVVGAVLAEFLASNNGIGYIIRNALYGNRLDQIIVALIYIGFANWVFVFFLKGIEIISGHYLYLGEKEI